MPMTLPPSAGRITAIGLSGVLAACSQLGLITGARAPDFDRRPVPMADPGSPLAPGWEHGAFMQIFVRAWRDSDGDGIGDLRGVIEGLDYLQALGIKGIWLMPFTVSADRDHGYAVTDFRGIESAYGTLADLDHLLHEAHRRGIGVVMDYVINHAGASHPAFVQSAASAHGPRRDWFIWQQPAPQGWQIWGRDPWVNGAGTQAYFATFGAGMPDFNLRSPAVVAWHHDNLRYWLNRGLDGFRFDAVPHLVENGPDAWNDQPESYALMRGIQQLVGGYARRTLVCEATASPQRWATAEGCGSAFAFGLERHLLDAARGREAAIAAVAAHHKAAPPTMANMLANHDLFAGARVWDQLQGDAAAYRLAASTYLLLPGTPFIYYGEEIGMAGVPTLAGDRQLRTPMSWTGDAARAGFTTGTPFRPISPNARTHNVADQQADPRSLLAHYRALLALRNRLPSIARGSYESSQVQGRVYAFQRRHENERTLVVLNYGTDPAAIRIDDLGADAKLVNEHPAGGAPSQADARGSLLLALAPQSLRVLRTVVQP